MAEPECDCLVGRYMELELIVTGFAEDMVRELGFSPGCNRDMVFDMKRTMLGFARESIEARNAEKERWN